MAPTHTPKRPVMTGTEVWADGSVFGFSTRQEALAALKFLSVPEAQAAWHCTWTCQGTPPWVTKAYAEDTTGEFEWHPDSPFDLMYECGAPTRSTERGWECMAGHAHERGAEYFEADEIEAMVKAGHVIPSNARLMDGRTVR